MAPRKTTGSDTTGGATQASDTGSGSGGSNPPATTEASAPTPAPSPQPEQVMFSVNLTGSVQGAVQVPAGTPFSEVLSRLKVAASDTYNYRQADGKSFGPSNKILQDHTITATPKTSRG